ncbi:MAG: hypothetical protein V4603_00665 [Pseudomonadota bacterium]
MTDASTKFSTTVKSVEGDFLPDLHPLQAPVNSLNDVLNRQMVSVPGFEPPTVREDNLCPLPAECTTQDMNEYRSAGVLLEALAAEARAWSSKLPPTFRPAIVAILHGGLQIDVRTLAQISFDGIRIEGLLGGNPCSMLAHQNTVQLICHAVSVVEEAEVHRPIGFIWPDRDEVV